jgi:hypothetical protein
MSYSPDYAAIRAGSPSGTHEWGRMLATHPAPERQAWVMSLDTEIQTPTQLKIVSDADIDAVLALLVRGINKDIVAAQAIVITLENHREALKDVREVLRRRRRG